MRTRKTAIIKNPNVAKHPFMIYHRVYNTTGATSGAGTAYPSGAPEFTVGFNGDRVARSIIVFVMFYRSLFVFLPFSVGHCVLYVRFTDTDYPFGISKLVLLCQVIHNIRRSLESFKQNNLHIYIHTVCNCVAHVKQLYTHCL